MGSDIKAAIGCYMRNYFARVIDLAHWLCGKNKVNQGGSITDMTSYRPISYFLFYPRYLKDSCMCSMSILTFLFTHNLFQRTITVTKLHND